MSDVDERAELERLRQIKRMKELAAREAANAPATAPPTVPVRTAEQGAPSQSPGLDWSALASAAGQRLKGGFDKTLANTTQGLSFNTAHVWVPKAMAALDEVTPWGDTNNSFDVREKQYRNQWNGQLEPWLTAAGGLPLWMAGSGLNTLLGGVSGALLNQAGSLDQQGKQITSPEGLKQMKVALALGLMPPAVQGMMSEAPALVPAVEGMMSQEAPAVPGGTFGDTLQDLAGRLKVKTLKPVPTLAEDMAALPGGKAAVGRKLLEKSIGGFTKDATAEQLARAFKKSSSSIDSSAAALDSSGAPPPDLSAVTTRAFWRDAVPMAGRPLTRATGEKLGNTLADYINMYEGQPQSYVEGLKFRRELDNAIYSNTDFGAHPAETAFGESLKPLRADVNATLTQGGQDVAPELADQFKNANLETRQLGLASKAADRAAGRGAGNKTFNLHDMLAPLVATGEVGAGMASGHSLHGLSAAAISMLLGKYGWQATARALYGAGAGLNAAPGMLPGVGRAITQGAPALSSRAQTIGDMLRMYGGAQ